MSRLQRVRHELKLRDVQVSRVERLSPHVRSVTLQGPALADFASASFDDHVKLILSSIDGAEPIRRDYTPRSFDVETQELTLEFALHGDGPAAAWAAQARPGQRVTVGGPRGSMIIPTDFDWHLLVGDETALPAIARRLEELPAGAVVQVIAQVSDTSDRRDLQSRAGVAVQWVHSAPDCLATVQAWSVPPGEGFAWCAGEANTMAELRRILLCDKALDKADVRVAAYWKQGTVAHHETLDDAKQSATAA